MTGAVLCKHVHPNQDLFIAVRFDSNQSVRPSWLLKPLDAVHSFQCLGKNMGASIDVLWWKSQSDRWKDWLESPAGVVLSLPIVSRCWVSLARFHHQGLEISRSQVDQLTGFT